MPHRGEELHHPVQLIPDKELGLIEARGTRLLQLSSILPTMVNDDGSLLRSLTSVLGISFVSGINLYAAVLTVGLSLRFGWISGLPEPMSVLANPIVLIAAGVMYAAEFAADKVPFFTPIWDAIHTFIRPLGAALLAWQAAANLSPAAQLLAAMAGGSIALGTHSAKAGFRLAAHSVPEPGTHSFISVIEDFSVVGILALAYTHPMVALVVLLVLLVAVGLLLRVFLRALRSAVRRVIGRVQSLLRAQPGAG